MQCPSSLGSNLLESSRPSRPDGIVCNRCIPESCCAECAPFLILILVLSSRGGLSSVLAEEPSAREHLRLPGFVFQVTIARIGNCGCRIMLAVQQVPRNPLELDGSFVWQPIMKGELICPPSSSPGCPSSFDPFPFLEGAELHLCQLRALQTLRAEATSDEMNLRPMRKARAADCHHESAAAHRVLP